MTRRPPDRDEDDDRWFDWHERWHHRWHERAEHRRHRRWARHQHRHARHHARAHAHHRARGPFAYLQQRLRRKIFAWFGVSILLTGLVSALITWVVASPVGWWNDEVGRLRTFAGNRFADTWDDPDARRRLAAGMAADLERFDVVVHDRDGTVLDRHGSACTGGYEVPVARDGVQLGAIEVCLDDEHRGNRSYGLLWIVVAGIVLWGASGAIAMRLTRPLVRLVELTRQIGAGNLDVAASREGFGYSEFRIIGEAVADMAGRIRKQLDDQRELLAAVSHELRTPLGHLRVLVDIARQSGAQASWIEQMEAEIVAIDTMVDQLLARSRVDFGNLERRELDAVELGLRALERAGLDPTLLEAQAERIAVEADAALVLQALANLLRNAQEHAGGPTALAVTCDDRDVTWTVVDAGPGFGAEVSVAFDAFTSGSTRKPRAGSLGLGLALVRRIAEAHGGFARAKDLPEQGAKVSLTIPRRPHGDEDPEVLA